MKIKKEKIKHLIDEIDTLYKKIKSLEKSYSNQLKLVAPDYKRSARNLIHYLAMRSEDLSDLQTQLGRLGLSRFASVAKGSKATAFMRSPAARLGGERFYVVKPG